MGTKIGKGELRLGEEVENHYSDGGMTYKYRHWQVSASILTFDFSLMYNLLGVVSLLPC